MCISNGISVGLLSGAGAPSAVLASDVIAFSAAHRIISEIAFLRVETSCAQPA
jgi:hypothetical protein